MCRYVCVCVCLWGEKVSLSKGSCVQHATHHGELLSAFASVSVDLCVVASVALFFIPSWCPCLFIHIHMDIYTYIPSPTYMHT